MKDTFSKLRRFFSYSASCGTGELSVLSGQRSISVNCINAYTVCTLKQNKTTHCLCVDTTMQTVCTRSKRIFGQQLFEFNLFCKTIKPVIQGVLYKALNDS